MPYYRGDYYRGDYYRGDPGVLGFLGKAVGAVARAVTPGWVQTAVGAASSIAGGLLARPSVVPSANPSFSLSAGPGPGTSLAVPSQLRGGGTVAMGSTMVGVSPRGTFGMKTVRGTHPNRSSYYTSQGYVAAGTKLVPNRTMNVGNARALKRALRRAHGFAHLARSVMSFQLTGKKTGRGHFKAKRRAR